MMKKTTSALAIAALLGTGAASAVTFQVNDETTFSIAAGIYATYKDETDTNGDGNTSFFDNGSDLVFSGEHTANGMTTFFNIDFDGFDAVDAGGTVVGDEASAGITGDFGTVVFGSDASAFDKTIDGLIDSDETAGVYNLAGDKQRIVRYESNDLNGFSFMVEGQIDGDDQVTAGDATDDGLGLAAAVSYDLGAATLHAAYDDRGNNEDEAIYGVGAAFSVAGVDLGVAYQKDDDPTTEADLFGVSGSYNYGGGSLYGVIQNVNFDSVTAAGNALDADKNEGSAETDDSFNQYMLGINYNITDALYVYGEYLVLDRESDEGDVASVGAVAYF